MLGIDKIYKGKHRRLSIRVERGVKEARKYKT